MRLIDADAIKWDKCEDADGNPVYVLDKRDIDKQPTAYEPDKVVEQLNDKFRVVRTDEDLEWNRAMDDAITIVKGGGVNGKKQS